ncbi:hypothetical protein LZ554_005316 [Drepanopeziza brunnea f. sp. 'monogermtubi']|nr:hypothetical protein LZ554_005316 [Drepanopeziza brunnea f. sp. 'monogermtubi']
MASSAMDTVLSPEHIHKLIDEGVAIVLLDRKVLKVPNGFLKHHPGGDNVIKHMVGRNAQDEIDAFHPKSVKREMLRYQVGIVAEKWVNVTPPIQREQVAKEVKHANERAIRDAQQRTTTGELPEFLIQDDSSSDSASSSGASVFDDSLLSRYRSHASFASSRTSLSSADVSDVEDEKEGNGAEESSDQKTLAEITDSFRELVAKLEGRGLYETPYWAYAGDAFRVTLNFTIMLLLLRSGWYLTSAVFMGCFWHQLVFTAHDAGHRSITHDLHWDSMIGMTLGNYLGGLSLGWWKRAHNIHHIVCNDPAHDPDIEHLPFMAISPALFQSLYSTHFDRILPFDKFAQTMVPYQKYMYYPLLCFGRFNLYALSLEFLVMDLGPKCNRWHRFYELVGQAFFWYWFGYLLVYCSIPTWTLRVAFVLVSHCVTMPLHVQFTLSHFAMGTVTPGPNEPWAMQQLRTTMDVDCPAWMDWFHGGLQFQAVHHLFPSLPRHNLRQASQEVKAWSKSVGIKYEIYGFQECNGRVLSRLEEVGRQARFFVECQDKILEKGDFMRGDWE